MFTIDVDLNAFADIYADIQPDLSILQQGIISATCGFEIKFDNF